MEEEFLYRYIEGADTDLFAGLEDCGKTTFLFFIGSRLIGWLRYMLSPFTTDAYYPEMAGFLSAAAGFPVWLGILLPQ